VSALGECLDLLLPMTYHAILHEPVDLIERVTRDVAGRTKATVTPVVQVTAESSVAGPWDWGWQVTPAVLGQAVEAALSVSSSVVLFPFEGLDGPRRAVLSNIIRSTGSQINDRQPTDAGSWRIDS
jgi:hypothetical protein